MELRTRRSGSDAKTRAPRAARSIPEREPAEGSRRIEDPKWERTLAWAEVPLGIKEQARDERVGCTRCQSSCLRHG